MSKNWGKHSPIRISWNVLTNLIFLVLLENFTNNSDRTRLRILIHISPIISKQTSEIMEKTLSAKNEPNTRKHGRQSLKLQNSRRSVCGCVYTLETIKINFEIGPMLCIFYRVLLHQSCHVPGTKIKTTAAVCIYISDCPENIWTLNICGEHRHIVTFFSAGSGEGV